jgi:hypothetical protein
MERQMDHMTAQPSDARAVKSQGVTGSIHARHPGLPGACGS